MCRCILQSLFSVSFSFGISFPFHLAFLIKHISNNNYIPRINGNTAITTKKSEAKNNKNKMQTFICLHLCGCVVNWFCCDCCCCYCCSCCWRRWHWSAILQLEIDIAIAPTRLTNYSTTVQQINCRVASIDECECRGEEMK